MESIDLDSLELLKGGHKDRDAGVCLLEAAAWFAGEPHSDRPACVCPALAAFGRSWNDALDADTRQKLKAYIPRMIGTANDGAEDRRAWMATDWLVRVCTPEFLDAAGLTEQATGLRGLPEIHDQQSAKGALPLLAFASRAAAAPWDAVGAAAGAAARVVVWAAVWDAVWVAAEDATWAAVWDATRAAVRAKLAPAVARLQTSAFDLFDRMIDAGKKG